MSFWDTSTGESATKDATGEYDAGGGYITIPDGSTVLAYIKEAKWDSKDGKRFVNLQWKVEKPEDVAGAVVFQKLWVADLDMQAKDPAKKKDKALRMLANIDNNCGSKLAANGGEPTDDQLMIALCNNRMAITCKIWELIGDQGQPISGNWVASVGPKDRELKLTDDPIKQGAETAKKVVEEDDVPF